MVSIYRGNDVRAMFLLLKMGYSGPLDSAICEKRTSDRFAQMSASSPKVLLLRTVSMSASSFFGRRCADLAVPASRNRP